MSPRRGEITVAYLTTTLRGLLVEVLVTTADGVPQDSVINLDAITTIPKSWLLSRACSLSQAKMDEVRAAVLFVLDLS